MWDVGVVEVFVEFFLFGQYLGFVYVVELVGWVWIGVGDQEDLFVVVVVDMFDWVVGVDFSLVLEWCVVNCVVVQIQYC